MAGIQNKEEGSQESVEDYKLTYYLFYYGTDNLNLELKYAY